MKHFDNMLLHTGILLKKEKTEQSLRRRSQNFYFEFATFKMFGDLIIEMNVFENVGR